jgi:hypothetical protein
MHLDERNEGDYRIFAGALEATQGDGYIAAVIVSRWRGRPDTPREAYRDESLACGHRWPTADAALSYAMSRGQQLVRSEPDRLTC